LHRSRFGRRRVGRPPRDQLGRNPWDRKADYDDANAESDETFE
jgi:hypothetical protein